MQKIPAIFRVRQKQNEKNFERPSGTIAPPSLWRKRKICALCLSKKNLERLYTNVHHENSGQDKHTV
jgi:hypothetical protein